MKRILNLILITAATIFIIIVAVFFSAYIKYNTPIPKSSKGIKAENLAQKIASALNYEAYKKTNFISWKAKGTKYVWDKQHRSVDISWKNNRLVFNQDSPNKSIIKSPTNLSSKEKRTLIDKAEKLFNNDSFWLVAPFKLFDKNVERMYVPPTSTENASLIITYKSGGSTPGDTYQWFVNDDFIPTKYKMWVSIIPIKGLPATWENWKTSTTGIKLAHTKKIIDMIPFPMTEIKTWNVSE
ncbi:hypothetical protein [Aquimarina agarilytica]|uniref:hypothetical protein n=1 Tax=Aquimarina agarilytica TaxID=1087449 RepID=UPI00028A3A2F|nr:hypothetical protein [Aquimarina agarilytica]